MSLINRALNRFAAWAIAQGVDPDPGVKTKAPPRVWGYTVKDYLDGGPYLTRILFPRVFGFRPMLHRFHRADGDRALHNHPWKISYSLILRGSYTEERKLDDEEINGTNAPRTRTRLVRWFNILRDTDFHRVVELRGDEVWTLFVTGPRVQSWGFEEDGEFTDWREYIDRKKAEHSVEPDPTPTTSSTLFADLDEAKGDDLDTLAWNLVEVRRHRTYTLNRRGNSTLDSIETDAQFRARIARILRGE